MFELANPCEDATQEAQSFAAQIARCKHDYQMQATLAGWRILCQKCGTWPLWERGK